MKEKELIEKIIKAKTWGELLSYNKYVLEIREKFFNNNIIFCTIINAKSGYCSEDCAFCAQSRVSKATINKYRLLDYYKIEENFNKLSDFVSNYSIVISGHKQPDSLIQEIARYITLLSNKERKNICASLGSLTIEQLKLLKDSGLYQYHHNLETSKEFYPKIVTTHPFEDRVKTIENAKSSGLKVCSGGIFGLGETWEDRISMAYTLKSLEVDSVPINFLHPIKGTPLEDRIPLSTFEAVKIIMIYRIILRDKHIRICGGRSLVFKHSPSLAVLTGADGIMTGNYLTTIGRTQDEDYEMVKSLNLIPIKEK